MMVKAEIRKRAEELYHAALRQEGSRRAAFLEEACAGDEALLREVESLLAGVPPAEPSSEVPGSEAPTQQAPGPGEGAPGRRLSHYEIVSRIGSGGMGEVYRARDLSLGRDAAIKVMQTGFASEPERLKRFEREARAAAALNHPNIATVYEIGAHEGTHFIAMELVEGRTLRELLEERSLCVKEVLEIATQVAGGLAKAHAAGIVHRDLKPGNLMVTSDGLAKVLDFGLAKRTLQASDVSNEITREGTVLGTVQYMSPEQAAGRGVDHRSDQFSFGSILYEMATGKRAFEKDTTAETLAAIIKDDPEPIRRLDANIPGELSGIVERCLSKDPDGRYDSTGDLAKDLARSSAAVVPAAARRWIRWRPVIGLTAFAAVAAAVLYWQASRPEAPESRATSVQVVPLTTYPGREAEPTFSPDGSQVAFSWNGENQDNHDIYVKVIGTEQPLRLTSDPARDGSPAWSPDGGRIAFLRAQPGGGSEVRLIAPTGGPETRLTEVGSPPEDGLAWSPDGQSLAVVDRSSPKEPFGLFVFDTATGRKERLTSPASATAFRGDLQPAFSPDGRTVAFKRADPGPAFVQVVPASGGEPRALAPTNHGTTRLAWTPNGEEIIFDAHIDVSEGALPNPSVARVSSSPPVLWGIPVDGGPVRQLVGSADPLGVAVSREGNRLTYARRTHVRDIWRLDLQRQGSTSEAQTPFIASTERDMNPQFSPDDRQVVFTSGRSGAYEIWVADHEGANLLRLTFLGGSGGSGSPRWSPDGKNIAFDFWTRDERERVGLDIYVVSASGGPPGQITTDPSSHDAAPSWSRDGRWIYFASDRSGQWQVWRVPSDGETEGSARQVTQRGGFRSIESVDGEYLYFCRRRSLPEDPENAILKVPVDGGDEEVVIESLGSSWANWEVTAEGIYFVDLDTTASGERWVVNFFSFDQHGVTQVAQLRHPPYLNGPAFDISSDGRWILSTQVQETADLMLVENFR
jgi:Tol biopolymer transport system component/predicted Ser/Thr protein kinase